eukprot:2787674-Ditylum_brightwellii.AAC.1
MNIDNEAGNNFEEEGVSMLLLNDDNPISVMPGLEVLAAVGYYPFLHHTLDKLARAAASSVVHSVHVDASDSISRLLTIGSALVLGQVADVSDDDSDGDVAVPLVVDAKLYSMAVDQLSQCMEKITAGNVS